MRRGCVYTFTLCVIVALLLTSCGEAGKTTTPPPGQTTSSSQPSTTTSAAPYAATTAAQAPKYGGTLSIAATSSVVQWDEAFTMTVTLGGFSQRACGRRLGQRAGRHGGGGLDIYWQ